MIIGFVIVFLIGVIAGVVISYELFSFELSKQLCEYEWDK